MSTPKSATCCPPWDELLAHRLDQQAPEPAPERWVEALEHLDSCAECKREAVLADPTLVFGWATRDGAPDADGTSEAVAFEGDLVEEIRAGVHTLRRGRELEGETHERHPWHRRASLAAALVVALALGFATLGPSELGPGSVMEPAAVAEDAAAEAGSTAAEPLLPAESWSRSVGFSHLEQLNAPAVEAVASPNVKVYRVPPPPDRQIDIVMVIDPAVDV